MLYLCMYAQPHRSDVDEVISVPARPVWREKSKRFPYFKLTYIVATNNLQQTLCQTINYTLLSVHIAILKSNFFDLPKAI